MKPRPKSQQDRIDRQYRELRMANMDAFHRCIQAAEAIGINHSYLSSKLSDAERIALLADIEQSLVSEALISGGYK